MKRSFACVLLLSTMCLTGCSLNFQEFTAPDGSYSIKMPGKPTRTPVPGVGNEAWEVVSGRWNFGVVSIALPAEAAGLSAFERTQAMNMQVENTRMGLRGTVKSQSDVTVNGFQGKEVELSMPAGVINASTGKPEPATTAVMRFYLVNDKMLILMARSSNSITKDSADVKTFYDSFRLTATASPSAGGGSSSPAMAGGSMGPPGGMMSPPGGAMPPAGAAAAPPAGYGAMTPPGAPAGATPPGYAVAGAGGYQPPNSAGAGGYQPPNSAGAGGYQPPNTAATPTGGYTPPGTTPAAAGPAGGYQPPGTTPMPMGAFPPANPAAPMTPGAYPAPTAGYTPPAAGGTTPMPMGPAGGYTPPTNANIPAGAVVPPNAAVPPMGAGGAGFNPPAGANPYGGTGQAGAPNFTGTPVDDDAKIAVGDTLQFFYNGSWVDVRVQRVGTNGTVQIRSQTRPPQTATVPRSSLQYAPGSEPPTEVADAGDPPKNGSSRTPNSNASSDGNSGGLPNSNASGLPNSGLPDSGGSGKSKPRSTGFTKSATPKAETKSDSSKDSSVVSLDGASVEELLKIIGKKTEHRRVQAAERLKEHNEAGPNQEVAEKMLELMQTDQLTVKNAVAQALEKWACPEINAAVAKNLKGGTTEVRQSMMRILAAHYADGNAEAIAQCLVAQEDRKVAVETLISIGAPAEGAVIKMLDHRDSKVKVAACDILKDIGTADSIAALTKATTDWSGTDRQTARKALKAIEGRK